jgi:hypothetical protein
VTSEAADVVITDQCYAKHCIYAMNIIAATGNIHCAYARIHALRETKIGRFHRQGAELFRRTRRRGPRVRNLPLSRERPGRRDNSRANIVESLNAQQGSGGLIAQLGVHALEPRLDYFRALPFDQNAGHVI